MLQSVLGAYEIANRNNNCGSGSVAVIIIQYNY